MAKFTLSDLKKALAYHFALVTVIDMEIGRVLDWLRARGELDNTIVVYTADHGDFAGDHGVCLKNLGIYESIHRIPFLLSYPGGPRNAVRDTIIESVDLFPTLCELADVPMPDTADGRSIVPEAKGTGEGKTRAICEWDFPPPQRRVNAIRTGRYRLVYYSHEVGGELYDHEDDPYEMVNRWDDPACSQVRMALLEQLLDEVNLYARKTDYETDTRLNRETRFTPTRLLHKSCKKWSDLEAAYS
jgi:arylsulfatase A-like enzyme